MSSFLSLPSAKNPKDLPSGDQNGKTAPSVSLRLLASREPTSWSHNVFARSGSSLPMTAAVWPSGAMAMDSTVNGSCA